MDLLIRNLPDDVHAELVRRAAEADTSVRAYVRAVLAEHVAVPSLGQWLRHLREIGPVDAATSGAELVAASRAEDDALVGR